MEQFCTNGQIFVLGEKGGQMMNFHCLSIKQWGQFSNCEGALLLKEHRRKH